MQVDSPPVSPLGILWDRRPYRNTQSRAAPSDESRALGISAGLWALWFGSKCSAFSSLQTHLCADPRQDPFSPFDWSVNPVSPGPDPGMQWALQGPASSAFDSRIHLPPLQPAPCPTDFQGYNTWAPQPSVGTSPPAVQPVTISSSFLHFSQVQSTESLELAQLINAGDSLLSSFCMDSQRNPPCEPNHGAMPALVRHWE